MTSPNSTTTIQIEEQVLKAMIKEVVKAKLARQSLTEAAVASKDPPTGVAVYASKLDKLVEDTIDQLEALANEGEEMIKDNPTHDYAVQERNHAVLVRVGIIKGLKSRFIQVMEQLHRDV